ncbi:sel1 repeat family protein [Pseudomonas syringae UB303]|uniref:Sel1 repeat family protein n=1 Tax=Pseudomonas syringae UB303 TaxID=1357287 RepID=A0AAJ4E783_PSESX|nr:sel1 repeat family protein [Pseudomonas syringae UB303]SOQ04268.1 Sel1 repeat-containing protein [Pseudomonas syringae pv. syringae]
MPTQSQMDFAYERLKFSCTHEKDNLPALDKKADVLYKYALYLEQTRGDKTYNKIAAYYRIAAAYGHYKAATNLQALLSEGKVKSPHAAKETIELVKTFIDKDIPGAYYDMAHYLEKGYGVKQDLPASKAYFRRAADLGNPDAQYYVARLLSKVPDTADVMQSMYKCAMEQGNGLAGVYYAGYSRVIGRYADAVSGYHVAVRNGDYDAARNLERAFEGPPPSDKLYYMALQRDIERVERLEKIGVFLTRYERLGPKVPDIDQIVPLPPAKLPEWDGTFEWLKKRESTPPAEKPAEDMIRALSQEKGLDPETGLPLPK